jgi:hypothetical protein
VRDLWNAVFGFADEGGLRRRVRDLEDEAEKRGTEVSVLRTEVQLLAKAVDRNTNALYTVVGTIVATGVVAYLVEKGMIG